MKRLTHRDNNVRSTGELGKSFNLFVKIPKRRETIREKQYLKRQ